MENLFIPGLLMIVIGVITVIYQIINYVATGYWMTIKLADGVYRCLQWIDSTLARDLVLWIINDKVPYEAIRDFMLWSSLAGFLIVGGMIFLYLAVFIDETIS